MSRRNHLLLLLPAVAFLLLGARAGRACSCAGGMTVLDSYEWADVVVIARAVSLEREAKQEGRSPEKKPGEKSDDSEEVEERAGVGRVISTKMAVERVFKGDLKAGDEMVFAQGGGADCIYTFDDEDVGHKYLFYLKRLKGTTVWIAGTCGRSGRVGGAQDDLLYLNKLGKTRGRTRISGTASFDAYDPPEVAGLKIRIAGAGKTYEVKTDENGVYEIYDVPAGKYTVEPEMPRGWRVSRFYLDYSPSFAGNEEDRPSKKIPIVLEDKKHAGLDLRFEIDNAIAGKIYDTTGRPMNGVCLNLVPAEGEVPRYFYKGDCTEKGGAFRVEQIPPGAYVLVVNREGKVTSSAPFGTFYYPNVSRREDATVFHFGPGDFVENLRVYVPKMEETITVEGVLLYSDGRPAADGRVEFRSEKNVEDNYPDAQAKTDAKGRFSIKILKGMKGQLYGEFMTYSGEFENCPALEAILKKSGNSVPEVRTPAVELNTENSLYGIELRYPFPSCKKARI